MRRYRRRLPHCDAPGAPVFVTWSLTGSVPPGRWFGREHLGSGEAFAAWDRLLDSAGTGPRYLARTSIAILVIEGLLRAEDAGACSLDSFVVMPSHVHLLWTPRIGLAELMRRVKGGSAREANRILLAAGEKFWQEEYFDRMVRSEHEAARIRAYIEWNPVKAGLAAAPELFPWSSACLRRPDGGFRPVRGLGVDGYGEGQG